MTTEEKKEIQKNRMKKYFIESAKELIKEEGIENLTTKKIGDRAGYSYATIYNYFENFNELICICVEEFSEEMKDYLKEKSEVFPNDINKLKSFTIIAIEYVLSNVNIYNLFLTNSIDFNYFKKSRNERFIHPSYNLLIDLINSTLEFSTFTPQEIHYFADLILSLFHSKMQFYITLKYPENIEELKTDILNNLDFLIYKIKPLK